MCVTASGNDYVMIRHLSFNLADSALAWRTTLPQNDFKDCKYLETLFVNNFQGTYNKPRN